MDRQAIDLMLRPMEERCCDRNRAPRVDLIGALHSINELRTTIVVARASVDAKCHDSGLSREFNQSRV